MTRAVMIYQHKLFKSTKICRITDHWRCPHRHRCKIPVTVDQNRRHPQSSDVNECYTTSFSESNQQLIYLQSKSTGLRLMSIGRSLPRYARKWLNNLIPMHRDYIHYGYKKMMWHYPFYRLIFSKRVDESMAVCACLVTKRPAACDRGRHTWVSYYCSTQYLHVQHSLSIAQRSTLILATTHKLLPYRGLTSKV